MVGRGDCDLERIGGSTERLGEFKKEAEVIEWYSMLEASDLLSVASEFPLNLPLTRLPGVIDGASRDSLATLK